MTSAEDVDEFIESVDEVSRLINGLAAGTIPPDYVDRKLEDKQRRQHDKAAAQAANRPRTAKNAKIVHDQSGGSDSQVGKDADTSTDEEARQAELARKVEELKANRERKLKARAKYEQYVQQQQQSSHVPSSCRSGPVDYKQWDLWCPSDEEDDLFSNLTPQNPGFRAMERDINERHKRMTEQRQLVERQRVAGNAAMAAGQWAEALRCYENGLQAQRHNMPLHANAALAAIKNQCYVQAMEHCDKVLSLAENLHNTPRDPMCAKALQRRAAALQALDQHPRAVEDLARALDILGGSDKEVEAQLHRARLQADEGAKQRRMARAIAKSGDGCQGEASNRVPAGSAVLDVAKLREVEQLAVQLRGVGMQQAPEQQQEQQQERQQTQDQAHVKVLLQQQLLLPPLPKKHQVQLKPAATAQEQAEVCPAADIEQVAKMEDEQHDKELQEHGVSAPMKQPQLQHPGLAPQSKQTLAPTVQVQTICRKLTDAIVDDNCSIYFRLCGGVQAAAQQLLECHRAAALSSKGIASTSDHASQQARWQTQEVLLSLLEASCSNELTREQMAGDSKLLAAVVELLASPVSTAAVRLLFNISTADGVRQQVCKALAAQRAAGLKSLLDMLPKAAEPTQAVALSLAGNCMLDKGMLVAAAELLAHASNKALLAGVYGIVQGSGGSRVRTSTAVVAEKALVLLGNMCGYAQLRQLMVCDQLLVDTVVRLVLEKAPAGEQQHWQVRQAAAGCLANLCMEPAAVQGLLALFKDHLASLLDLACAADQRTSIAVPVITARAASVLASIAKQPSGAAALEAIGAAERLIDCLPPSLALSHSPPQLSASVSRPHPHAKAAVASDAAGDMPSSFSGAYASSIIRTIAAITSRPGFCCACSARLAEAAVSAMTIACSPGAPEATVGNAALCLGHFAAEPAWKPLILKAGAVDALVEVVRSAKGKPAARNAAIALAKAAGDDGVLERMRELRGVEAIYQYVKP